MENFITEMGIPVKIREMNTKDNHVYIQDSNLLDTDFQHEKRYSFEPDYKNGAIKIYLDPNGRRKVAKRDKGTYINPVIDIKPQHTKEVFKGFEKCLITMYKDVIIVEGLKEEKVNGMSKRKDIISKIINFAQRKTQKQDRIVIPRPAFDVMAKVSGSDYEQLSLFNTDFTKTIKSNINVLNDDLFDYEEVNEDLISVVSFCSGAGMLDYAFKNQGYDIKFGMDINEAVKETYTKNIGDHMVIADMHEYDLDTVPEAECAIIGSPCQELSSSNQVTGKVLDHPKNKIISKFIDWAQKAKTLKVFALENVPELLTKGKKFVEEMKERLSDFSIQILKLNSEDFGSAQSRERVFIIGSKIGKVDLKPPVVKLVKTVGDVLKGLHDNMPNQLDYSKSSVDTIERMKHVPPGGNWKDLPDEFKTEGMKPKLLEDGTIKPPSTQSNVYRRLDPNKPSVTIANIRKSIVTHPWLNRILSVRECLRIQGMPDDFVMYGPLAEKQQMVANGVPYEFSMALAKAIKETFMRFRQSLNQSSKLAF